MITDLEPSKPRHLERAIEEATGFGSHYPMMPDRSTIDIAKLASWISRELSRQGLEITISCVHLRN